MANEDKQVDVHSPGVPADPVPNLLSRILDFLFDRFNRLPSPLRAVAYFIFLGFFCATAWRLVAGQYVVHGVIWDGDSYATACEIRLRSDYFSVNSNGMYYAILSPTQYYRFAALGETELPVTCRTPDGNVKRARGPFKVALNLWDDEFADIHLDAPLAGHQGATAGSLSFSLISSAYAQERRQPSPRQSPSSPPSPPSTASPLPSSGDRLVMERITLGRLAEEMREVEFEIDLGRKDRPLLLEGDEAGKLRLKRTVAFGERYYFDVPPDKRGRRVSVGMEASGLFGNEETFKFRVPTVYNRPFIVKGSQGSTLILRLAPQEKVPGGQVPAEP
jgi:hypothetical protein